MAKRLFLTLILAVVTSLHAAEITDEKKQIIDEMLEVTGAIETGRQMGASVSNSMLDALARSNARLTPQAIEILRSEITHFLEVELIEKNFFSKISYQIYDKYYTVAELEEIVDFYKSDVGKKVARLNPQIAQEAVSASRQHVLSLKPRLESRIKAVLEREGLL